MVVIRWIGQYVADDGTPKNKVESKEFLGATIRECKQTIQEHIEEMSDFGWILNDQEIIDVTEG